MKSLRSFHNLMMFTTILTIVLSWVNSHDWWLPAGYEIPIHPGHLLPTCVCLAIWWVAPGIIRRTAKPDGKPCWGHEAITHETIGVIITIEAHTEFAWLILWQPHRIDRQHLDCEPDGVRQLFFCEHSKNAVTPKPGDRVIALLGPNGLELESYPRPRRAPVPCITAPASA